MTCKVWGFRLGLQNRLFENDDDNDEKDDDDKHCVVRLKDFRVKGF